MRRVLTLVAVSVSILAGGAGSASAHTESDLVAVPAGSEAVVTLKPTHGCGGSPTVEVRIRADAPDASAVDVVGWTASAESDGEDRIVAQWVGGVLPSDETGAFPIRFTVPDTPGALLLFPSVQICEDGSELRWIDGDPTAEFPAPRLLVLPEGYEPAATIDDVPADAPGRDQLVAIVDVDNEATATTQAPAEVTVPITVDQDDDVTGSTVERPATTVETSAPTSVPAADPGDEDSDGGNTPLVAGVAVLVVAAGAAAAWFARRRSRS
jgi:uncharacterized protein YcnI